MNQDQSGLDLKVPMRRHELTTIVRLAWPNLISFGAQLMMLAVDGAVAARLGQQELAAVALILPLQMLLVQAANGAFGAATAGAVARAVGAGNPVLVRNVASHALMLATALGIFFACLGGTFAQNLIAAIGGSGAALELASAYAVVLFPAAIAIWINGALTGIVRGAKMMWVPTYCAIAAAVIHLALAPALAFGFAGLPALGLRGLAYSFLTAYVVTLAPLVWMACRHRLLQEILPKKLDRDLLATMLRTAGLAVITTSLSNISVMLSTRLVSSYGSEVLAGYGLAARLEYVVAPLVFSVGTALVTLCGHARGAGQMELARRYAIIGVSGCTLIAGLFGAFLAIYPNAWIHLFSPPLAISNAAHDYLRVAGFAYGFFGAGLTAFFACQAFGDMRRPLFGAVLRIIIIAVGGGIATSHFNASPMPLFIALSLGLVAYGVNNVFALLHVSRVHSAVSGQRKLA